MTLLVRNEQDLIVENILFHYSQGINQFIVMNNLSDDSTASLLSDLGEVVPLHIIDQNDDNYSQSVWVTQMARLAYSNYSADWVINNDADEFWLFPGLDAQTYLHNIDSDFVSIGVKRHNAVLLTDSISSSFSSHPSSTVYFEQDSLNSQNKPLPGKCLHRGFDSVEVSQGNHSINTDCVVYVDDLKILHFPYRSFEIYSSKIRLGGAAYARNKDLSFSIGSTWREQYRKLGTDEFLHFWENLHISPQDRLIRQSSELIFHDDTLVLSLSSIMSQWKQYLLSRELNSLLLSTHQAFNLRLSKVLVSVINNPGKESSLPFNNLPFLVRGPELHLKEVSKLASESNDYYSLLTSFGRLRDISSLFPANLSFHQFLSALLSIYDPNRCYALESYASGEPLVLYLSCAKNLAIAQESASLFESSGYKSIIVVGGISGYPNAFDFDFSRGILSLPVPDSYEFLGSKMFYASLVLSLFSKSNCIVKVDDDITLEDSEKFSTFVQRFIDSGSDVCGRILTSNFFEQCHGWHIDKCSSSYLNKKGYQYPMPASYPSGGFGYVLSGKAISSMAAMYLNMASFFDSSSVQLEDVFIGHAISNFGLQFTSCFVGDCDKSFSSVKYSVLPGLCRSSDRI